MKLPPLAAAVLLSFTLVSAADEPVYDVAAVTPDNAKSLHVDMLAGEHGWEPTIGLVSIGGDAKGLIVEVSGGRPVGLADPAITNPDKWNSVEIFFGGKKGSGQVYEAIIRTDVEDPKKPQVVIKDLRDPAPETKPAPAVEMSYGNAAFSVTAHLPWSDLGIEPKNGAEFSLQVYVNEIDEAGRRHTVGWHPEYRDHKDPAAMYRLRLAAQSSPRVELAVRASLDQGRPRVDVYSSAEDSTGRSVQVKAGASVVASGAFGNDRGDRAVFIVPESATEVVTENVGRAPIDFTELHDLEGAGVLNMRPFFKQSVFSGEKFPVCDIEKPADAEQALGKCSLTPTFYDANYNEVKTADKPGRYGAIVHVETESGLKFNRFVTLYRAPEELLGRALRPEFTDVKLPPELGIDPEVASSHLRSVGDLFGYEFRANAGLNRGPDAAILLAWLSELKPDDKSPDLHRTGPSEADQKWWYGLKKKTGNLRTDYFVHLPPDYDKDPQKKWPVILFLHGSGERGYDLKLLARQPLVQGIEKRKDFPFILIAPQVSPGEWWSIPELDDLLDGLPAKYRIDPDRIYLTGLSMGGFGTWSYLAAEPGRFAAAAPICGGGDPEDAARFKDVPIWVFHGEQDDAVPIQRSQEMVDALQKLGSNVKFTKFPGVDHFSWIPAYKDPELFKWFLEQKRK